MQCLTRYVLFDFYSSLFCLSAFTHAKIVINVIKRKNYVVNKISFSLIRFPVKRMEK